MRWWNNIASTTWTWSSWIQETVTKGCAAIMAASTSPIPKEKPLSMNPFAMSQKEFNLEQKDFLKTLVALLWKGADGLLTPD
jgi:hypothetical protein